MKMDTVLDKYRVVKVSQELKGEKIKYVGVVVVTIPLRLQEKNRKHFRGVYEKGYVAAFRGEPRKSPYDDPGSTWATAFHRYWLQGYDTYHADYPEAKKLGGWKL